MALSLSLRLSVEATWHAWCTSHVLRRIPHWSPRAFLFTISLIRPVDWLYAFPCQRPNPEPCVCQAGALPLSYISSPSFSEARFHYVAQATSNSWLPCAGVSGTHRCAQQTLLNTVVRRHVERRRQEPVVCFSCSLLPQLLLPPCFRAPPWHQRYTDSKQSWPWERGAREVPRPSAVCSWPLRQLNNGCLFFVYMAYLLLGNFLVSQ